jgi:RNA-binding protein
VERVEKSLRERVKKAHHGRADVIIGKKGVTEAVLKEIDRMLELKEVVKVKMLRTAVATEGLDRREIAAKVAEALGARLMGVRGRTFVLYRPKKRQG